MKSGEKGRIAEERAAQFLKTQGYALLARNFRWKGGEIDIIARKEDVVVFVEVRSRASSNFGTAAETIGAAKREKIRRTALLYIQNKNLDCPLRFDVIAFDGEIMEHTENAFEF
jgi:putative endonuclease